MRLYKVIGHTADLRLKVEGDSLRELFTAALEGMASILKKGVSAGGEAGVGESAELIEIEASGPTLLLIDFLSEVLTRSQIEKKVFMKVEFDELTDTSAKARVYGAGVTDFDEDIKAATYHEADVRKNKAGKYETVIVFDI
ncbi:archease [Patescibacteria group bacterium]|nr:archease [Patescibacteria group bacterium]MBU1703610.1 archease [Patescibacteria group bacterium]MBU1953559.1 archease [Patescibacteria group bacterium]